MVVRSRIFISTGMLVLVLIGMSLWKFTGQSLQGVLIFSQIPTSESSIGYLMGNIDSYPTRARIVAVDPENTTETFTILTEEFYSARAAEISYDGKYMLFAGQQKEGEPWQIWEMKLRNRKVRRITSNPEGCTDPAYLPDGRIIFCGQNTNRITGTGQTLYTCDREGSAVKRITFHPHFNYAPSVLMDGRVLYISQRLYPDSNTPALMVLRPDGTKAELYYKNQKSGLPGGRVRELSEKVVFIEFDGNDSSGGDVITVSRKRPLHSKSVLTAAVDGDFLSVFPLPSGNLAVSYRKSVKDHYALFEFDLAKKQLGRKIYSDKQYHSFEPVLVVERVRPKKLPSIVNEQKKSGWLLCLNSNFSREPTFSIGKTVQLLGIRETIGEIPLEEDGSFYIEVPADTPFRLNTLDENGQVVSGPSAWIWVRPNERWSCIGCHADHELTPENQVPLAINNPAKSLLK